MVISLARPRGIARVFANGPVLELLEIRIEGGRAESPVGDAQHAHVFVVAALEEGVSVQIVNLAVGGVLAIVHAQLHREGLVRRNVLFNADHLLTHLHRELYHAAQSKQSQNKRKNDCGRLCGHLTSGLSKGEACEG